ncbi:hypothetical protein SEVIR_1G295751v4 [Setaria viridis]|uniref:Uncharacterized protein n=1 Tax=Setaria viridis TaxID=4556 RepID=A0A4U6WEJ8_SETVI|nr:hypothetical protein SEVIR_1G295751v2 [Setaria viridis]
MNGVEIHPPVYEKKAGRTKKSRKKARMELEGGANLSKHGATMHYNIRNSENHTKRNHSHCAEQNQGFELPNAATDDEEVDLTVLQEINPKAINPNMDPS